MFRYLNKKGFTLVEIMIVVGIVALLVAFAVPAVLKARMNANESVAKASLRLIAQGCESYRMMQSPPAFPPTLQALSAANPPYIDSVLGTGVKQGYTFTYIRTTNHSYSCTANPTTPNVTGVTVFYVDESGTIRLNNAAGLPIE